VDRLGSAPLLLTPPSAPPEPPKSFDLKAAGAYFTGRVKEKGFVGLSVPVLRDGRIAFAKRYGRRSIGKKLPVEADTSFAVGSITKRFTRDCVLLLAGQGKLALAKYYTDLTRAKDTALRSLMDHTGDYPLVFLDPRRLRPVCLSSRTCRELFAVVELSVLGRSHCSADTPLGVHAHPLPAHRRPNPATPVSPERLGVAHSPPPSSLSCTPPAKCRTPGPFADGRGR
jgi:hypothetical protein